MSDRIFIEGLESRTFLSATGTHDLLYVRVQFADQASPPESASTASSVANNGAKLVSNYSGGQLKFRVQTKLVKLSHSAAYYKSAGTSKLANDADAALRKASVDLSPFEHISYRYNGSVGSFAGLGIVSGSRTWIKASSGSVLAHELGHNLGLGHSNFANPTNNSKSFGASDSVEYGDPFSNMGSGGSKDWEAHQKWSLGWIGGAEVKTVQATAAGSHTYTLSSHDDVSSYSTSSVYLVRLVVSSSTSYYISYRHDVDGLLIHRDSTASPHGGVLIDLKPATSTASDAKLAFGKSVLNTRSAGTADDIRFAVVRDGTHAKLTITLGVGATA